MFFPNARVFGWEKKSALPPKRRLSGRSARSRVLGFYPTLSHRRPSGSKAASRTDWDQSGSWGRSFLGEREPRSGLSQVPPEFGGGGS